MSDQSLREALVAELRRHGVDEFFEVRGIADAMARVSAAHPEALGNTGGSDRSTCPGCGREVLLNGDGGRRRHDRWQGEPCNGLPGQDLAARPLLDREALYWAISEASERQGVAKFLEEEDVDAFTSAALTLARPMPTPEQIDAFLQEWRVRPGGHRTQTEAVNYRRKMRNAAGRVGCR